MRSRRGDTFVSQLSLYDLDRMRINNELQVESRVASRRAARAKEREYRMREFQKQLKEAADHSDQLVKSVTGVNKYSNNIEKKGLSSHSGSRRSSKESLEFTSTDAKQLQEKVNEGEERLKEAMVSNGQLEKEKQYFSYQIETLKDDYQDLEESYYKLQRDYKDKSRNYELLNRDFAKIKDDNSYLKECVKQRDQVLKDNGLRLNMNEYEEDVCNSLVNGNDDKFASKPTNGKLTISKECAAMLSNFDGDTVEEKINCIIKEKKEYLNTIKQLKSDLEFERERNREIENNNHLINGDVKANEEKMIHDYKFKLLESEKEKNNLQNSIVRLETQLERMKLNVDELEKNENDLKIEKRKTTRELREATSRIEELEASNIHLQKRIDKLMSSRLANINSET